MSTLARDTNPRPIDLHPEFKALLQRNGMQAFLANTGEGVTLMVQGHDSPPLAYPLTANQQYALTRWVGGNSDQRRAYDTFASIVAADFDMPRSFVHARNAGGRVAMGLYGYRIGVGEYGRTVWDDRRDYMYNRHGWRNFFGHTLGWSPRMQEGMHLRRVSGELYYPGSNMVAERSDKRMKPGELQSGGYGFYYKGHQTAPVVSTAVAPSEDVLAQLEIAVQPYQPVPRAPQGEAKSYNEEITSDVYFTNEKWQEVLKTHGLVIDAESKTITVQSTSIEADMRYDLTDEQLSKLTSNSVSEVSVNERLSTINEVISGDFKQGVTMEHLNSKNLVGIELKDEVLIDLQKQMESTRVQELSAQQMEHVNLAKPVSIWDNREGRETTLTNLTSQDVHLEDGRNAYMLTCELNGIPVTQEVDYVTFLKFQEGNDQTRLALFTKAHFEREGYDCVIMNGQDLTSLNPNKGWYREGQNGRAVSVEGIRVEKIQRQDEGAKKAPVVEYLGRTTSKSSEGMTERYVNFAINGNTVQHKIDEKTYDRLSKAESDEARLKILTGKIPSLAQIAKEQESAAKSTEVTYRMTAVINGETITHEISQKQYNKFLALDDMNRMKLFSKVFPEVNMKDHYQKSFAEKLSTALGVVAGGLAAAHMATHIGPGPDMYVTRVGPGPGIYYKPGVDSPQDIAQREFNRAMTNYESSHGIGRGL